MEKRVGDVTSRDLGDLRSTLDVQLAEQVRQLLLS